MSIYKRGSTWWGSFSANGVKYRVSLETENWQTAQTRFKERIADATAGKLARAGSDFRRLGVAEACGRLSAERADDPILALARSTIRREAELFKAVAGYWGSRRLSAIKPEEIALWQRQRITAGLSPRSVNMELTALRKVLKRAKLWHLIAADVNLLRESEKPIGRALTQAQKCKLLETAASRPGSRARN